MDLQQLPNAICEEMVMIHSMALKPISMAHLILINVWRHGGVCFVGFGNPGGLIISRTWSTLDALTLVSNKIHIECLWYCFYDILQRELDEVKESWNSHYIRASRHYTCHGIPNKLYFTPESVGVDDHKEPGVLSDILTIENEVTVPATDDSSAQYQEYFEYALNELALSQPQNWRTAQIIYEKLVLVGE